MRGKLLLSITILILSVSLVYALPAGFSMSTVTSGLSQAITIRFAPDNRVFFLEQYTGLVKTMSNVGGNYVLNSTIWATIPVDATGERGLLGIAFDPDFTTNRHIYFYYSVPGSFNNRVIRMTEDTTTFTGNTLSIVTVLEIVDSTSATNHNGGNLTFGPDTMLYITVGDGGGSPGTRSQETTHFLGKILSVNPYGTLPVPYTIPSELFYSLGLRNSFDFAWNPVNNVLYATENGPSANDELNRIIWGGNYGWPIVQGYSSDTRFISPIYDWGTPTICPTGICFYPPSGNFPVEYDNNMFVVDCNNGRIYRIILGTTTHSLDTVSSITTWDDHPSLTYADIDVGPDGSLYIAAFSRILKVAYTSSVDIKLMDLYAE